MGGWKKITLCSTRIVTADSHMLAVPNSSVMNKTVASYTNYPMLRLDIAVTVGVKEDLDRSYHSLVFGTNNPDCAREPKPYMAVTKLNDYNVWASNDKLGLITSVSTFRNDLNCANWFL